MKEGTKGKNGKTTCSHLIMKMKIGRIKKLKIQT